MQKIPSREFQKKLGEYQELALKEGVTITFHGRDRLVLIDADTYKNMRKQSRVVQKSTDLPDSIVEQIRNSRMSEKHNHLNDLLDKDEMKALIDKYQDQLA